MKYIIDNLDTFVRFGLIKLFCGVEFDITLVCAESLKNHEAKLICKVKFETIAADKTPTK